MYDEGYDPGAFRKIRSFIAHKKHICGDCGKSIRIGERYYRISGKYDGTFYYLKAHTPNQFCW